MVAIALGRRGDMLRVIGPEDRVVEPVGRGVTPDRAFLDDEQAELIGQVVPGFIPGLRVHAHGDVIARLYIQQGLGDHVAGLQGRGRPGGRGVQVDGNPVQEELAVLGPELTKTEAVR